LLLAGCGEDAGTSETRQAAAIGRTASGPEEDAVVLTTSPKASCSGTLVAPNLMITTAHCVALTGPHSTFTCTETGELINGGSGAGEIGDRFLPHEIEVHTGPGKRSAPPRRAKLGGEPAAFGRSIIETGTTALCRNDLAFVVLDRSLQGVPIVPLRLYGPTRVGEIITSIGYGATPESDDDDDVLRHRREGIPIFDVGAPPRTFTAGFGMCSGDSGGPALSPETGAALGVLSLIHGNCGAELGASGYTELASFADLARRAFDAAGAEPWLEGEPVPGTSAPGAEAASGCSASNARAEDAAWTQALILFVLLRRVTAFRRRKSHHLLRANSWKT
jgi:hypothetical protein